MSEQKKKISIVVPCYNEQENVRLMANAIKTQFETKEVLKPYDFDILFIDNDSADQTREELRSLCAEDKQHIKAIFNAKNFGQFNSPYYAMLQTDGDATMLMAADFQDPPELIPEYVKNWEAGYKIVIGVKEQSTDGKFIYALRCLYYKLIKKFSQVDQIEHFTGFGLYDRAFIEVMRELDDPTPFLRGIVAELGFRRKEIPYSQPRRRAGKTSNNFYTLYDAAMLGFTSYTKIGLRMATFAGGLCAGVFLIIALVYLVMKLIWWDRFPAGTAPLLIGMLFLGSVQIFFIGLVGEYILSINQRVMKRPLVVEEERLNFPAAEPEKAAAPKAEASPKTAPKRAEEERNEAGKNADAG